MKFLEEYLDPKTISTLEASVPESLKEELRNNSKLVIENIKYLQELGIKNYDEVFLCYYDMFLLDVSTFISIFDKYDPDDLIAKIKKNIHIVEIL